MGVLVRELAEGYTSLRHGRPAERRELPIQYADYASWEREWLQGAELEKHVSYWRRTLATVPQTLHLPLDRLRPSEPSFQAARRLFELPPDLTAQVKELSRERDATLFMTLMTAFSLLLARYAQQDRFAIGAPVAHRTRSDIEPLIGFFVNTLVLDIDLRDRPSFLELLDRVRDTTLGALAHQHLPFEKLVEELDAKRDLNRSPLFQVLFVLQNAPIPRVSLPEVEFTPVRMETRTSNFDLSLSFTERGETLNGGWVYNRDLFDATTAERGIRHLTQLLRSILADPSAEVWSMTFLTPEEGHQITLEWNAGQVPLPGDPCLHHLFEAEAQRSPDRIAVVGDQGVHFSYRHLDRLATRVADRLRCQGIRPEARVGLHSHRAPEVVLAMLGILKAGGAFVPLDLDVPKERLKIICEDARLDLLLYHGTPPDRDLPVSESCHSSLHDALIAADSDSSIETSQVPLHPPHLAYVLHTSGSTGRPKGVMIPHRGIAQRIRFAEAGGHVVRGERFLQKASLGFDVSLLEIFIPIVSGGTTVILPPGDHQDPGKLVRWILREQLTQVVFPPSLLRFLLVEKEFAKCHSLRAVVSSAETLPVELQERYFELLDADLYNRYGPTEASVAVSSWKCERRPAHKVPIGRPIAEANLHVLDHRLRRLPMRAQGELFVGGPNLARGYFGQPAKTAERFIPHPWSSGPGERLYATGDLVRLRPDASLEFWGRVDHQVQVRGVRVEPGEVESALKSHPEVQDVVVLWREESGSEGSLVAYVVPEGPDVPAARLRAYARERLAEAFVPSAFVSLEALPLLPSGKVDRSALPSPEKPRPASTAETGGFHSETERVVARIWSEVLDVEHVDPESNFFDLGGHSLLLLRVRSRLRDVTERELPVVELFRHTTVRSLARYLQPEPEDRRVVLPGALPTPATETADIAIIGMAGRFPGASDIETLWDRLVRGDELISFFSEDELQAAGVPPERLQDPHFVPAGGVLEQADRFDAEFFDIPPREAEIMDPQQRVFLECAWEALENAGYDPTTYPDRIGVFAGSGWNTYLSHLLAQPDLERRVGGYQVLLANDKDFLATRTAYKLSLRGPCLTVQTACSTSLVASHLARRSLQTGDCEMALAGGVSIAFPQDAGYMYQPGMILSPDGHCRAFDAQAAGTVRGNGIGLVVLKRLGDALADRDHIYAVIRGSAINNDGDARIGYTAPSVEGQAEVIAQALDEAGVEPSSIGYVEAHGTGTSLGDPIEIAALREALDTASPDPVIPHIALGSIKSNLGHLNTAAGAAGLIKTALMLERSTLPPSLHFERPNPEAPFGDGPFYVNTQRAPWPENPEAPRRAGVSSFGIGGTNAHVILEEPPAVTAEPQSPRGQQLLVLSARSEAALERATDRLAAYLEDPSAAPLADVAFTLQVGRRRFSHRRFLVARDAEDARMTLRDPDTSRLVSTRQKATKRPVVFLFPGQGSQYMGMGRDLWDQEDAFREAMEHCAHLLEPSLDASLLDLLYPDHATDQEAAEKRLTETRWAQPALFAVEYSVAKLWMSWGIQPRAMLGHSLGEYVAACLAGVLSLEDALELVAHRGRMMQEQPAGGMMAVGLAEEELRNRLPPELSIAAVNGPRDCVVAGPRSVCARFEEALRQDEVDARRLHTSHAFHSRDMEPVVSPFTTLVARKTLRRPEIPFVSGTTGRWIRDDEATRPEYWGEQLRRPIRFRDALEPLTELSDPILLEVGPGRTLSTLARRSHPRPQDIPELTSLPHPRENRSALEALLTSLGKLWAAGVDIPWQRFQADRSPRRVPLPTYPFEKRRYWLEAKGGTTPQETPTPLSAPTEHPTPERRPVEARDSLESRIAELWKDMLGLEAIGIHDDFFALGGSSLIAVRLNARMTEELDVELDPHLLLEAPTVAELAEKIRQTHEVEEASGAPALSSSSCLVPLQTGGSLTPLFLVHPAGGHVYFYRQVAELLGTNRPVFGLRAFGLEEGETPHKRVEDMAACYVEALQEAHPTGPCLLGGSSMGGTVAFEMAQQLRAAGREVRQVILIDTPGPGQMPDKLADDAAVLAYLFGERLGVSADELGSFGPREQLEHVLQLGRDQGRIPEDLDVDRMGRLLELFKSHMKALRDYRPRGYEGALAFLRAQERRPGDPQRPEQPWFLVAEGAFQLYPVPGNHITLHHPPNLSVLVDRLRQCLSAA